MTAPGATARFIVGDSLAVLRSLPDASVDLVLTSPPFLALRSYLPAGDPAKALEVGTEPSPGDYLDVLLDVVEECRRVLAPHGSLCVELGDTYAGSGGAGGDYGPDGLRSGQPTFRQAPVRRTERPNGHTLNRPAGQVSNGGGAGWPLDKSLCLIPELFRFALVYGLNPLTGRRTPQWRARNVVRWCRPNPPVGALGDKVRPATSDMVVACVDRRRYFDLDAIREPHKDPTAAARPHPRSSSRASYPGGGGDIDAADGERPYAGHRGNPAGAPPHDDWWHDVDDVFEQDAWKIATAPYKGSHYATWPPALCRKPILAMCPERVCTTCDAPSERLCGHDTWRSGVVLDPFAGSGTTLAVAVDLGRSGLGIDLDRRNAALARERVGMWLEVVEHGADAEAVG